MRGVLGSGGRDALLGTAGAAAADPIRTSIKVVGAAPVGDSLRACLTRTFTEHPGYTLVEDFPAVGLVVFANTDSGDNVNPRGVSFAIAHVNHVDAIRLAKVLLIGPDPTTDEEVREAVSGLVMSGGVLDRLNVAHMGVPDERATRELCRSISQEFVTKYPATATE